MNPIPPSTQSPGKIVGNVKGAVSGQEVAHLMPWLMNYKPQDLHPFLWLCCSPALRETETGRWVFHSINNVLETRAGKKKTNLHPPECPVRYSCPGPPTCTRVHTLPRILSGKAPHPSMLADHCRCLINSNRTHTTGMHMAIDMRDGLSQGHVLHSQVLLNCLWFSLPGD